MSDEHIRTKKVIGNKYELWETIGQGTWAKVKRAVQLDTREPYAVKVFYHCTLLCKLKDGHAKLRSEHALFSQLHHPNLIAYYDLLEDHDKVYLVLEYCAGGHLKPPYEVGDVRKIMTGVLLGLQYLHSQGIAHHDIKPANILLTHDRTPKLSDFGIAEQTLSTHPGQCHSTYGTPAFQPPEVVNLSSNQTYDGYAADIWSLGIVLYYLLTDGQLLFNGDTVYYVLKAISECTADPKLSEIKDLEARRFLASMLRVDPKQRQTASQLLQSPWLYSLNTSSSSTSCCTIT